MYLIKWKKEHIYPEVVLLSTNWNALVQYFTEMHSFEIKFRNFLIILFKGLRNKNDNDNDNDNKISINDKFIILENLIYYFIEPNQL